MRSRFLKAGFISDVNKICRGTYSVFLKWILAAAVVLTVALVAVPLFFVWIEKSQARENTLRLKEPLREQQASAKVAVTVFSRSG